MQRNISFLIRNGGYNKIHDFHFLSSKGLETLYDQLQREDVNSPSVYQSLGHQQTSSNFTNHEGYDASLESFSGLLILRILSVHIHQDLLILF